MGSKNPSTPSAKLSDELPHLGALTVRHDEDGQRLDMFLLSRQVQSSRKKVKRLIDSAGVRIADRLVRIASWQVRVGDEVRICEALRGRIAGISSSHHRDQREASQANVLAICASIKPDILFENSHVLVINKPPGYLCGPGSMGTMDKNKESCRAKKRLGPGPKKIASEPGRIDILSALGNRQLQLVHRLDLDTSGVMILAKTDHAYHALRQQWLRGKVHKVYLALVAPGPAMKSCGQSRGDQNMTWEVSAALTRRPDASGRVQKATHRMRGSQSCDAKTLFTLMAYFSGFSEDKMRESQPMGGKEKYPTIDSLSWALVRCEPKTGRTHQIRVHMLELGTSVVGDKIYGDGHWHQLPPKIVAKAVDHHMLHASLLKLSIPSELSSDGRQQLVPMIFRAPLRPAMQEILETGGMDVAGIKI